MGKTRNKPRTKGNVQPASSSRAAEIMAVSRTQVSTGGLGGFAQLLGETPFAALSSSSTNSIADNISGSNLNPELVLILKKLSKRDPTTKLKALEELEAYLKIKEENDELSNIMSAWAKFFVKLAIDVDRRIRFTTFNCHLLIVSKIKKRIAPHLKEIISIWIISLFDQSKDVARIANESFQTAFPPGKRTEVLVFAQTEILSTIHEIIINKVPETLSDPRFTSKEDMDSKYARVVASSYFALAHLIDQLSEDTLSKSTQQYNDLFDNTRFWGNLTNENSIIRKSCYNIIKVLVTRWPKMAQDRLDILSTTYLMSVLNDKDASVYSELWDSLIVFTKTFPQSWLIASRKKPMLPKLYNFLRSACHGTGFISYPCILPLISQLPQEMIDSNPKFHEEFFLNFWKGLSNPLVDRANSDAFLQAYSECLVYWIFKLGKSGEKQKQVYLLENKFYELIEMYFESKSETKIKAEKMCSILARHISRLITGFQETDVLNNFIKKIRELCINTIKNIDSKLESDFKEVCQRLSDLLVSIPSATNDNSDNVTDFITSFVEDVFCITLSECEKVSGYSAGLFLLLSNLARDFSHIVLVNANTNMALKNFISTKLFDVVRTTSATCLDHIFDLFSLYLSYIQESPEGLQIWSGLVQAVIGIEVLESKIDVMSILINKVSNDTITCLLNDDKLNEFLVSLTNQLLYLNIEPGIVPKIENLLERSLSSKASVLTSQIKSQILDLLSKIISECVHEYYIGGNSNISKGTVLSALRIYLRLFKDDIFAKFFLESEMFPVIGKLFELTFVKPHENPDDDIIKNVQESAQECWEQISNACGSHSRREAVIDSMIQQIKIALLNIHYSASPTDFALRVTKLSSKFYEHDIVKTRKLISTFLFDEESWREISEPFLSLPADSSLSILDPVILPFIAENKKQIDHIISPTVVYDIYGLSVYMRLGLFILELINKFGISTFFFINSGNFLDNALEREKEHPDCHWILSELILIHVLCTDNYRSRNSSHCLWDTIHAEDSDHQGFKAFLEEIHVTIKQYMDCSMRHGFSGVKSIINMLTTATNSINVQADNVSILIKDAVKRSQNSYSLYWSRVLHVLCSEAFSSANITQNEAEELLDIVKPELSFNLATRMAFVLSIRKFLDTSVKFKNFQNNLIDNLCKMDTKEIFDIKSLVDNNAWECLCLLSTTTSEGNEFFLLPSRSLKLIECIQSWRETVEASTWSAPEFVHIQLVVARLLNFSMISVQEQNGKHWNFIFELVQDWLKVNVHLEIRYEAVNLFSRIIDLDSSSVNNAKFTTLIKDDTVEGDDLITKFSTYKPQLYELLSLLLFHEQTSQKEVLSEQYSKYLDILSYACQNLPKVFLINRKDELYSLLLVTHEGMQKSVYKLLRVLVREKALRLSEELELSETPDESIVHLDSGLQSLITEANNSDYLDDVHLANPSRPAIHKTFGYLLSWMLIFDHFENTTYKFKSQFISHLKELNVTYKLFDHIFETLGLGSSDVYDLSKWDVREFYVEGFEIFLSFEIGFPLLCAHLYYKALGNVPSLVRSWCSECKKRQLSISVDSYTEKYFSPVIIQQQLDMLQSENVKSQLEDEKFTIRVARSSNEVIASYNVDEYVMEISVRMPNNFPLCQAEFGTLERMGTTNVTDLKWAKLPVQTVVNSQNGNLDMALNLFKNNIKLRFQGVEDCTICYSVVSLDDRSLPSKHCNTCKNRFHAGSEVRIRLVVHYAEDYSSPSFYYGTDCKLTLDEGKPYYLGPGQMCLGITRERVKLPTDLCALVEGRSRFARLGLSVHITASFIHPGVNNRTVLEIFNASSLTLALFPGTKVCQMIFMTMEGHSEYNGVFQGQDL
ncbi:9319_t:CDS:10 [Acaulospora morrowiae]|uniref:E3 ubiquitin-protein ligase listerin n=1 Tax=Acaulospora morrowiae TaxID=94023 RepID=A0A9N9FKB5_9GLOM|nr:9319_t:CDS:10 [Acaulospora morrowiae]